LVEKSFLQGKWKMGKEEGEGEEEGVVKAKKRTLTDNRVKGSKSQKGFKQE